MIIDQIVKNLAYQVLAPSSLVKNKYRAFKKILEADRDAHLFLAKLEEIFYEKKEVDCYKIKECYKDLSHAVKKMIDGLIELSPIKYVSLNDYYKKIDFYCRFILEPRYYNTKPPYVISDNFSSKSEKITEQLLGGKGYNLFLLKNNLNLPVPNFFIITTNSFFLFLEYNKLNNRIENILKNIDISNPENISSCSNKIINLIKHAKLPEQLIKIIHKNIDLLTQKKENITFSVRSSAVAEDSSHSFAGQYKTILDISASNILNSYKEVIASKYEANALFYRIKLGYCDLEIPIAVICQQMIDPKLAGVIYSTNPESTREENIHIYAAKGIGEKVVSATTLPEEIKINRKTLAKNITISSSSKLLTNEQIRQLCTFLIKLEDFFQTTIDCEWCIDKNNTLYILQARPLLTQSKKDATKEQQPFKKPPILSGGITASRGIGQGKVFIVKSKKELFKIAKGSILVSETMPPEYVAVFERVNAIISEKGSQASHSASVARELGIPYICGLKDACKKLKPNQEITVDANSCTIYQGLLLGKQSKQEDLSKTKEESQRLLMLKQLLKLACQLTLVDPNAKNFRPEGCRSLHDIIRFVHETAMHEMFFIGTKGGLSKRGTKRLISHLPLTFLVLDVGGGLSQKAKNKTDITLDEITSFPMQAFWKGLSCDEIKWKHGEHFAWGDYDAIMLAGGVAQKDSAELSSYAILARDYMNLNIRFGYHFTQIDALCTSEPETNYIFFRFAGGGGQLEGRIKRAIFLVEVLSNYKFDAKNTGELVEAKLKHITQAEAAKTLEELGRLVAATRQMDMYLTDKSNPKKLAQEFIKGKSDFSKFH